MEVDGVPIFWVLRLFFAGLLLLMGIKLLIIPWIRFLLTAPKERISLGGGSDRELPYLGIDPEPKKQSNGKSIGARRKEILRKARMEQTLTTRVVQDWLKEKQN